MQDLFIALIIFTGFYLFYLVTNFRIAKLIGRRVCTLCFSASSTWITLIVLKELGLKISPVLLAVFLGGTAVGISYLTEEFSLVRNVNLPQNLAKPLILITGFSGAYLYAAFDNPLGLGLIGILIIFALTALTPLPKRAEKDDQGETKSGLTNLLWEKLKNCC